MLHHNRVERLTRDKLSSFSGQFVSFEQNEIFWIRPLIFAWKDLAKEWAIIRINNSWRSWKSLEGSDAPAYFDLPSVTYKEVFLLTWTPVWYRQKFRRRRRRWWERRHQWRKWRKSRHRWRKRRKSRQWQQRRLQQKVNKVWNLSLLPVFAHLS